MRQGLRLATAIFCVLASPFARPASAQQRDTVARQVAGAARFVGHITSIMTLRPVELADVRLMYVDSVHTETDAGGKKSGEFFIDTTRSRLGITDTTGAIVIRGVPAGHYVINVRRIGFEPFEGLLTMGTNPVEMELAMTQLVAILPPVRITASATDRMMTRLTRVGFISHQRLGTGGHFIERGEIIRRGPTYITDVLAAYGIDQNATYIIDHMPADWQTLRDYPPDLVIGIEFYRRPTEVPIEFAHTLPSTQLQFGDTGAHGLFRTTVIVWTYIP